MSTITAATAALFTSTVENAPTGLVGTLNVRIEDNTNTVVFGPSTTGVAEVGVGIYSVTLTAPATAGSYSLIWNDGTAGPEALDTLIVTATLPAGVAYSIDQIDSYLDRGGDADSYDDGLKVAAREAATVAFEQEAHRAIRSKTQTDVLDGTNGAFLFLPVPNPVAVTAFEIDGTATSFADIVVRPGGVLYRPAGWSAGFGGLSITYTHGFTETPADLSNAIAVLAASMVKDGPYDDRGYGVTDDGGFVRLMTAGVSGAAFSIPEVQACLMRYRLPVVG